MQISIKGVKCVWYDNSHNKLTLDNLSFQISQHISIDSVSNTRGELVVSGDYRDTGAYWRENLDLVEKMKSAGLEIEGPGPNDSDPRLYISFPFDTRIAVANYKMPVKRPMGLRSLLGIE